MWALSSATRTVADLLLDGGVPAETVHVAESS